LSYAVGFGASPPRSSNAATRLVAPQVHHAYSHTSRHMHPKVFMAQLVRALVSYSIYDTPGNRRGHPKVVSSSLTEDRIFFFSFFLFSFLPFSFWRRSDWILFQGRSRTAWVNSWVVRIYLFIAAFDGFALRGSVRGFGSLTLLPRNSNGARGGLPASSYILHMYIVLSGLRRTVTRRRQRSIDVSK
jgi:hypothetical protein